MNTQRGRVLKAGQLVAGTTPVPWDARTPSASDSANEAPSSIELLREDGEVRTIEVHCRCGRVHRMDLVGDEGSTAEEGATP